MISVWQILLVVWSSEGLVVVWVAPLIEGARLVVDILVEVVVQRADHVGRPGEPLPPEALLRAGVANYVLCELAEVHAACDVARDDLDDSLVAGKLAKELHLHHVALVDVRDGLDVLGLDVVEEACPSGLLVPCQALDLVEDQLPFGVAGHHRQQVLSLHALDVDAVDGILLDLLHRQRLQLLLVTVVEQTH